jgi:glycosyltransferase involved in cell wall biosynthesis
VKIGIVIPCYNESGNIPKLVERCKIAVSKQECEFILIDNGSTDSTPALFKGYGAIPQIRFLRLEKNQGYGGGIIAGLTELENPYIGWTHADLQTDPVDVVNIEIDSTTPKLLVKGSRRSRALTDSFFTFGMSVFMTLLFGTRLSDINAQPTIMSRNLVESWKTAPSDFSLDLYAYVSAKKDSATINRFVVDFSKRLAGDSKWNNGPIARFRMCKRTIQYALKLKRDLSK